MRRQAKHRPRLKARGHADAVAALQRSLVDDVLLAYVEWREESTAARDAYGRWAEAGSEDAARAHAAYHAALDREEAAASSYANVIEATSRMLAIELDPGSLAPGALWP